MMLIFMFLIWFLFLVPFQPFNTDDNVQSFSLCTSSSIFFHFQFSFSFFLVCILLFMSNFPFFFTYCFIFPSFLFSIITCSLLSVPPFLHVSLMYVSLFSFCLHVVSPQSHYIKLPWLMQVLKDSNVKQKLSLQAPVAPSARDKVTTHFESGATV